MQVKKFFSQLKTYFWGNKYSHRNTPVRFRNEFLKWNCWNGRYCAWIDVLRSVNILAADNGPWEIHDQLQDAYERVTDAAAKGLEKAYETFTELGKEAFQTVTDRRPGFSHFKPSSL